MHTIQAEGFLFRKALSGRPKLVVLVGVWIIFFPVLAGGIYTAVRLILNQTGFVYFFFFWVTVGFIYIAAVVLYRITKNYLTIPNKRNTI